MNLKVILRARLQARRRFALKWKNARPKALEGIPTPILHRMFPIEIWECVIDHLWDDHCTLTVCALVCRAWYPRSRLHILGYTTFDDRKQIYQLAKFARASSPGADSIKHVVFRGGFRPGEHRPVPHLGTFAALLARRLTNLELLCISNADWQPGMLQPDVFLNLSVFTSITDLVLYDVRMPSARTFGQLVCALPNLKALYVGDLTFCSLPPDWKFNPAFFIRYAPHMQLTSLWLGGISMGPIIEFLVSTTFCTSLENIFLGPQKPIELRDVQILGIPRLLEAAGSALQDLRINVSTSNLKQTRVSDGDILDLSHNTSLEKLLLRFYKDTQCTWMPQFLARISSRELCELILEIDIPHEKDLTVLDTVLTALGEHECYEIDSILTSERFTKLREVTFKLRVTADGIMPDADRWAASLFPRLPKLHARRVFSSCVVVIQ